MRLKMLAPSAFGKFHLPEPILLGDGLNIVRGDNEAGKSTLGAFILGMFYGFKKEGRTRISRTPEFERYRPWSGKDYRGFFVYESDGKLYRVERSFDPDTIKIYDETSGEEITRRFHQDSRKEYDFAFRHLGLTAKEFRNTVWIGQLGSPQEPGVGTEIQSKLESIVEGGDTDVSLAVAFAALGEERAKIKSPRSTKARLDRVHQRLEELQSELASARIREENLRQDIAEASALGRRKAEIRLRVEADERSLRAARYALLAGILSEVDGLERASASLIGESNELEWAWGLDLSCEQHFSDLRNQRGFVESRLKEIEKALGDLDDRVKEARARIASLGVADEPGIDESGLSTFHARYLACKAQTAKWERAVNDARRDSRKLETIGLEKGYPAHGFSEEILDKVEGDYNVSVLTEKEQARLETEVEKARTEVQRASRGGAPTLVYVAALVLLGIAVATTIMAVPGGIPIFALAGVFFTYGLYRQRLASAARRSAQDVLDLKEQEVREQARRVEDARLVLFSSLSAVGVSTIDELRLYAREVSSHRAGAGAAARRFQEAKAAWFEASAELSSAEKDLLAVLRAGKVIGPGDGVSDAAVAALRRALSDLQGRKNALAALEDRVSDLKGQAAEQKAALSEIGRRERALWESCGVESGEELTGKIAATKKLGEVTSALDHGRARIEALLSGRLADDMREEMDTLSSEIGDEALPTAAVSDKDYEDMRGRLDEKKADLSQVNVRLAGLEKGIRFLSEEGRPSSVIEEEIGREQLLEQILSREYSALDLAYETLRELSIGIRREFAPMLSEKAGEYLGAITAGRYRDVRVSPDLEMTVHLPDLGVQVLSDALSGGTLDQCNFALRIALAMAVTKKDTFPFFLDDSFVQYDDERLKGALSIVGRIADTHQVLLFSCHGREEKIARDMGLQFAQIRI